MKKKEHHMMPDDEKKCIWMTTGLISYKLCAHDYFCETCIFDQVMRNEAVASSSLAAAALTATSDDQQNKMSPPAEAALFYHQNHCWAKVEDHDQVRIGIDGILASFVSRIKTVALPNEGEPVTQDQGFAHIMQEKHILQLASPLTGTIQEINGRLRRTPQLLFHDPWNEGWLVTIKPKNLEHDLKALMFGRKALDWYQEKQQIATRAVTALLNPGSELLGHTMQDGGTQITGFVDALSSEQLDQIIETLLGINDHST